MVHLCKAFLRDERRKPLSKCSSDYQSGIDNHLGISTVVSDPWISKYRGEAASKVSHIDRWSAGAYASWRAQNSSITALLCKETPSLLAESSSNATVLCVWKTMDTAPDAACPVNPGRYALVSCQERLMNRWMTSVGQTSRYLFERNLLHLERSSFFFQLCDIGICTGTHPHWQYYEVNIWTM